MNLLSIISLVVALLTFALGVLLLLRVRGMRFMLEKVSTEKALLASETKSLGQKLEPLEKELAKEKASRETREVLIKEIHHRVKNNLQIISSLLNLQSRYAPHDQVQTFIKESQNRIKSIALIYEMLHQSDDLERIDFKRYAQNLANSVQRSYQTPHQIKVEADAPGASLGLDACVPCGLIINELVTNSFEHAFPNGTSGEIAIGLSQNSDGFLVLNVKDNGIGFPDDIDFADVKTLGLRLIISLTKQLNGRIEFNNVGGTRASITFKDNT
jgi:two-component sensor histidine kinase